MTELQNIIKSKASIFNTSFEAIQYRAIEESCKEYAKRRLMDYQEQLNKAASIESIKLFPALFRGEVNLWLRKLSFVRAKKMAQTKANSENRPVYVIRMSDIAYSIQSTKEARDLRKKGVYDKNVNAIRLHESADFVAYPKNK